MLADIFFSSSEFHLCVHSLTFALHGIPSHPRKVSRNKSEFGQSKVISKKERKKEKMSSVRGNMKVIVKVIKSTVKAKVK